ncbi:hypothetical protein D9M69_660760 [compost metagenome]
MMIPAIPAAIAALGTMRMRPAVASGDASSDTDRNVPMDAMARPRSSSLTESAAKAGPTVCRIPAPAPEMASPTTTQIGFGKNDASASPRPAPAVPIAFATRGPAAWMRREKALPPSEARLATVTSAPATGTL